MKYDCGFEKGNNWFRYRTGGIIINNNKMLFVYIVTKGAPTSDTPCGMDNREIKKAVFNTCPIY